MHQNALDGRIQGSPDSLSQLQEGRKNGIKSSEEGEAGKCNYGINQLNRALATGE